MKRFILIALLLWASPAFATSYFVTQLGAGLTNGSSLGNAATMVKFNANTMVGSPTGGDTVFFSGTITTKPAPPTNGTGTGASLLTLDFSGATLSIVGDSFFLISSRSFLYLKGGGAWSQTGSGVDSTYTPGCTMGACSDGFALFFLNNSICHDIIIEGFQATANGSTTDTSGFAINYCYNLTVRNNYVDKVAHGVYGDTTDCHGLLFTGNYIGLNNNATVQCDVITLGDAYNVTIEHNKLVQRAPGNTSGRHNDCIQAYLSGASSNGNPYGWIIRYNWVELANPVGDGNNSWTQLDDFVNGTSSAMRVYGNIFTSNSTNAFNSNGISTGNQGVGANYYFINNTIVVTTGNPGNSWYVGVGHSSVGNLTSVNNIGYDAVGGGGSYLNWAMNVTQQAYNNFYNWGSPSSTYYGTGTGAPNRDPLLTNPSAKDYSLQSGSPCKGAGNASIGAEFNQGIAAGSTWPNPTLVTRTTWDIGAFNQSSGGTTSSSLMTGKILMTGKAQIE